MNSLVEILLSTFNGEKYLQTQLDSMFQQDYVNWKLVVRDDGSTDNTLVILNKYIQNYPDKIALLKDSEGNIGYSNSFSKLLMQSSADYIMFCDQDDYWEPDKISTMLSVMLEEEAELPGTAHIVFSDLYVADSGLKIQSQSFLKLMRYSARRNRRIFFLKNYIPGCNLLFNRQLVAQTLKTDNIIDLHDHWLLLVCSSIGKLTYINKPLMKYRMHDNNAIGFIEQKDTFIKTFLLLIKDVLKYGLSNKKYRDFLYSKNIRQTQNICERIPAKVSGDAIAFAKVDSGNFLKRKMRNISKPYILERSLLKQLIYIICF